LYVAAVSHCFGADFRAFASYPTHGMPFDSATTPAAGLSTF
jgi:hypothetical protein